MDIEMIPTAQVPVSKKEKTKSATLSESRRQAFKLFKQKQSIKEVAAAIGRAESTTAQYLVEYIELEKVTSPYPWVTEPTLKQVVEAVKQAGVERLKPVFDVLQGRIDYQQIRIALACLRNRE
jgi:ATP-dependent DNA helicase RecQ